MDFDIPNPGQQAARQDFNLVLDSNRPVSQRAGNHRAESLHREDPVHGQPQEAFRSTGLGLSGSVSQSVLQIVEAHARRAADREHRRVFEERSGNEFLDLELDQLQDFFIDKVGLGQRDHAPANPEQAADLEVLASLGHDRLVRCYHKGHDVDPADPGQHVLDEAFVARHVDESETQAGFEIQTREA